MEKAREKTGVNEATNATEVLTAFQQTEILGREITLYGSIQNPLFLASDVAEWIDYSKRSNGKYQVSLMLKVVEDEKKAVKTFNRKGGNRTAWFLTEDGLYQVCMKSTKPIAKQMQKEIERYLISIRLTGGAFQTGREAETIALLLPSMSKKAQDILLMEFMEQRNILLSRNEVLTEEKEVLTEFYDDLMNTKGLMSMNIVSKELNGFGLKWLMTFLREKEIFFYKNRINIPYQRFMEQGLFEVKESPCADGKIRPVTYATTKGLEYIRKMLRKEGMLSVVISGENN